MAEGHGGPYVPLRLHKLLKTPYKVIHNFQPGRVLAELDDDVLLEYDVSGKREFVPRHILMLPKKVKL